MGPRPVLFVDPNLISRLLVGVVLRDYGFDVIEARSLAEARRIIDEAPTLGAVVTDADFGSGIDGFEIAWRARAAHPGVPIVYVSGSDPSLFAQEGVEHARLVPKPFEATHIARVLEEAIPFVPAMSGERRNP